jgi:hypothetical protein
MRMPVLVLLLVIELEIRDQKPAVGVWRPKADPMIFLQCGHNL